MRLEQLKLTPPRPDRKLFAAARHGLLLPLILGLLTGCGKQGEGERCDINNGSLDCETGLVCRSADQLSLEAGRGVALCCPFGQTPTVEACLAGAQLPDEPDGGIEPPPMSVDAGDAAP